MKKYHRPLRLSLALAFALLQIPLLAGAQEDASISPRLTSEAELRAAVQSIANDAMTANIEASLNVNYSLSGTYSYTHDYDYRTSKTHEATARKLVDLRVAAASEAEAKSLGKGATAAMLGLGGTLIAAGAVGGVATSGIGAVYPGITLAIYAVALAGAYKDYKKQSSKIVKNDFYSKIDFNKDRLRIAHGKTSQGKENINLEDGVVLITSAGIVEIQGNAIYLYGKVNILGDVKIEGELSYKTAGKMADGAVKVAKKTELTSLKHINAD